MDSGRGEGCATGALRGSSTKRKPAAAQLGHRGHTARDTVTPRRQQEGEEREEGGCLKMKPRST